MRFFPGNFDKGPAAKGRGCTRLYPSRRLVEECTEVTTAGLRAAIGRRAMLTASREGQPLRFQLSGNRFSIYLTWEPHRLPSRTLRWSDIDRGNVRLWFLCPGCRRRARKLFTFPEGPGSSNLADLRCRHCHRLTYLSSNSSGRKWYERGAKPLRKLVRERQRLLHRRFQTPRITQRLTEIEDDIFILTERLKPRRRLRRYNHLGGQYPRIRCRYRDISLLGL